MNNTFEDLYNITVSSHRNSDAIVYFESKNRKIITFNEYYELTKGYAVLFEEVLSDTDRGSWVGMQLPNSHIWFAVLFALQKTGYNVVLIDENAGNDLVRHFIKQTGMKALVTFRNCFYDDVKCINMTGLQPKGCTCSKPEQAWSSKMAFCTSGTTGTAKVYVFNSSAIVHSCQNIVDFYYRNDDLNTKGKESDDNIVEQLEKLPEFSYLLPLYRNQHSYFLKEFGKIQQLSPFKYVEWNEDEILKIISKELKWKKPARSWPDKSSNCSFNYVAQYLAEQQFGYAQHESELSCLVRENEITRERALEVIQTPIEHDDLVKALDKLGLTLDEII